MMFVNNGNILKIQEKKFTCIDIQYTNHEELAMEIQKYNIKNVRNLTVKKCSLIASEKEYIKTDKIPFMSKFIEKNAQTILDEFKREKCIHILEFEVVEKEILDSFLQLKIGYIISKELFTDGCFDNENKIGGASVLIQTKNDGVIWLPRKLHFVESSTECELYAL